MIRLEDNVPQNYIDESRDFQLFCRLYDCINNGVRFDIDSMIYLFDSFRVNNNLLQLLANRIGFFPKRYIDDNMMRYIISAFPYLIKYKGSKKAINAALSTVLKAENISAKYEIKIENINEDTKEDSYVISIIINKPFNIEVFKELLYYIAPTGYILKIEQGEIEIYDTELDEINNIIFFKDSALKVSELSSDISNIAPSTYTINTRTNIKENEIVANQIPQVQADGTVKYTYYDQDYENNINEHTITIKDSVDLGSIDDPNSNDNFIGLLNRAEVIGSDSVGGEVEVPSSKESLDDIDKGNK